MSGLAIPGLHLTQIGSENFLLEPSRALDIGIADELLLEILQRLQEAKAGKLYYDLSELPLIEPNYYRWLNMLARACRAINVAMVCIRMQPTAAFALSRYMKGAPDFAVGQCVTQ